jgi:hypothetical protein
MQIVGRKRLFYQDKLFAEIATRQRQKVGSKRDDETHQMDLKTAGKFKKLAGKFGGNLKIWLKLFKIWRESLGKKMAFFSNQNQRNNQTFA